MNCRKTALIILLTALFFPALPNKKAKVVTETGKKWDVLFLRMSNDTIFLKARKPNGSVFSISGHKSKFRKVEFSDGSLLDFSLSDFLAPEGKNKPKDVMAGPAPRDTVFLAATPSQQHMKDTGVPAEQFKYEPPQPATDTTVNTPLSSDTSAHIRSEKITTERVSADSEAMVSLETKPSNAGIKIDGNEIKGKTPLIAKDLSPGKKKGRGFTVAFSLLSAASFAGSAGTYYLYNKHLPKEEKTFDDLNNSVVKGSSAEALISQNKAQHEDAQMRLNISQILLGAGAVFLMTGIVFFF